MANSVDHYEYALNINVNKRPVSSQEIQPFVGTESDGQFHDLQLKRVLLFYNPSAAAGKSTSLVTKVIIPIFHSSDISTIVYPTKCKGDLTQYLKNESQQIFSYGIDAFVVVGGDGTMHEFVNGYIAGNYKSAGIAVILVNGGTGNSLCLTMNGFNDDNQKLTQYLQHIISNVKSKKHALIQWIDVVEFSAVENNQSNQSNENDDSKRNIIQYCASQSYFGIPSSVVHWANWDTFKKIFGTSPLRYDIGAFFEMCKHREYRLKFTFYGLQKQRSSVSEDIKAEPEEQDEKHSDGGQEMQAMQLIKTVEMFVAMKGKYFGKGVCITPFAKLDNGYLDVLILERIETRYKLISMFLELQKIKEDLSVLNESGVYYYRCKEVVIEVLDEDNKIVTDAKKLQEMGLPDVGGDGEIGPPLPLRLRAAEKAIPALFPDPTLF
mmetsp:Transcript_51593/g.82292  ORF Transcript_51593/g.82292 Transcript_51593/m.82292 type:complete len:436 (+) Transcript_51593:41-1348(+)